MRVRSLPHPFLKWAGGKRQLIKSLVAAMPTSFNGYHEPFVGGGALFFDLYRREALRRSTISDLNAELIDTYVAIRDDVDTVLSLLAEYPHSETFFYNLRAQDPWKMDLPHRAARMIYLNKTCFNGLYRVNRRGQFNTPFGRYKNPKFHDPENLHAVSAALHETDIRCASFESVVENASPDDFVYFDPPYAPLSATANFTGYHANGFNAEHQTLLRDVCLALTENGVHVMVSNSSAPLIRELYADSPFFMMEIQANRAINSNPNRRGKLTELLITNYPVQKRQPITFSAEAADSDKRAA